MKTRKKSRIFNEPKLYVAITIIGLLLIIFLPDADSVCEKYKKCASVLLDIGSGLFPTGLIGLVLVFMQQNQQSNEKFVQRASLLKEVDLNLYNLLNEICRAVSAKYQLRDKNLKKALMLLRDTETLIEFDKDFNECANSFSDAVSDFLKNKTDYLLTETFSSNEMNALSLLSDSITRFSRNKTFESSFQANRDMKDMADCLMKFLELLPEFTKYLKQMFNGNRIQ